MQIAADFTVQTREAVKQQRGKFVDETARQPNLVEYNQLERRAACLSTGAISFGALTGVGAIVAMPVAYLTVSNPTVRVLMYTVPVLGPAFGALVLAYKARQARRAAQALDNPPPQTAAPKAAAYSATTTTKIADLDLEG